MKNLVQKLVYLRKGATSLEYMLLAALIGLVAAGAASAVGGDFQTVFQQLAQNATQ